MYANIRRNIVPNMIYIIRFNRPERKSRRTLLIMNVDLIKNSTTAGNLFIVTQKRGAYPNPN